MLAQRLIGHVVWVQCGIRKRAIRRGLGSRTSVDMTETSSEVDAVCKDLLRQVHPDRDGGSHSRSYSADEVAAMLNIVRDAAA